MKTSATRLLAIASFGRAGRCCRAPVLFIVVAARQYGELADALLYSPFGRQIRADPWLDQALQNVSCIAPMVSLVGIALGIASVDRHPEDNALAKWRVFLNLVPLPLPLFQMVTNFRLYT